MQLGSDPDNAEPEPAHDGPASDPRMDEAMSLETVLPPAEGGPQLGIFWGLPGSSSLSRLVIDATPLGNGERYGEFLKHPRGHCEVWEAWRSLGPGGLAKLGLPATIVWHEYEHFPRGRVVFHEPMKRFVVYADRKLQGRATLNSILAGC